MKRQKEGERVDMDIEAVGVEGVHGYKDHGWWTVGVSSLPGGGYDGKGKGRSFIEALEKAILDS